MRLFDRIATSFLLNPTPWIIGIIAVKLAGLGLVAYVVGHFIIKFW